MAPKRQRRRPISDSDDEADEFAAHAKNTTTRRKRSVALQEVSSPKVKQHKTKEKERTPKSIFELLKGQAQNARSQTKAGHTHELPRVDSGEEQEDLIQDDSGGDDVAVTRASVFDRAKILPSSTQNQFSSISSQSFKLNRRDGRGTEPSQQVSKADVEDTRPWAEKYAPQSLEELAVHKKKVADVRDWLETALSGQTCKKLLILKGVSGVGKSTTVQMLAKDMSLDISEWKNPIGSEFASEGYVSMSAHFEEFLVRSGKFARLAFSGTGDQKTNKLISAQDARSLANAKKIVLIEEFPNTFMSASNSIQSFRSHVLEYLAACPLHVRVSVPNDGDSQHTTPIIMVITETQLTATTAQNDTFTAHRLLGTDILAHPCTSVIEFNPIAPTILSKALDLVSKKEARHSGRRRMPGPSVLKKLGEVGDVRSAIGSLEFLCLRSGSGNDWSGRVAGKPKQGSIDTSALTEMEKHSLEMVTRRGSTLGLFHAVGKVVYNKRDILINSNEIPNAISQAPDHSKNARTSQVVVEQLIDETGTDIGTFIAALHENYVPSCAGFSFTDSLNRCLDSLSDSDVTGATRSRSDRKGEHPVHHVQGAASDNLRQGEMAFQLAVRGILFALPDPVQRASTLPRGPDRQGSKSDVHKMFYPTSMRLSRQMEETDILVQRCQHHLQSAGQNSLSRPSGSTFKCIESNLQATKLSPVDHNNSSLLRSSLHCTNVELVVERLPYAAMIRRYESPLGFPKDLESITQFRGIDRLNDDISHDVDGNGAGMAPTRARERSTKTDSSYFTPRPKASKDGDVTVASLINDEVERLFLTDDDIEDD